MNTTSKPTIIPQESDEILVRQDGWSTRLARRLLVARLSHLKDGEVRLVDGAEQMRFGARTARCGLHVTITVRSPEFYELAAYGGTVGAGEGYINGHWRCDDLTPW